MLTMTVRSVWRSIRHSPGFTCGVVGILTLGLGVNAITFGLVDRLVLSGPAGLHEPSELRRVVRHALNRSGASAASLTLAYLDYQDLLQAEHFSGAAAESQASLLFGSGEAAERIRARLVTGSYFPLLGVTPAVGRFFTADESEREGARLAVLAHGFWQRRFGADPAVIGQVLPIGESRYTVVGVAPRHFTGTEVTRVDVFLPLEAASDEQVSGPWQTSRGFRWVSAIVRMAPGASPLSAAAEATALHRQGYAGVQDSDPDARLVLASLNTVRGPTASAELGVAALVGGVAVLVLLIAFANAVNLFLARSLRRREQVAVRLALGSGRLRLVAEQAAEGALLALASAAVAVLVAVAGAPAVQRLLFPQIDWLDAPIDLRGLLFVAGCAVLGGAIAAALPMWRVGRTDLVDWLRSGPQRAARTRTRTQAAMLVVQGALSVVLLVGAGLFVRSLAAAQSLDVGIDTDRLLAVSMQEGEAPLRADLVEALRDRVDRMSGVARTTLVAGTMPFVSSWAVSLTVPGVPERPRVESGGPYIHAVEPGYFETVGTRIVEGRTFTPDDRTGAPRVAIVNRTMARLYWPNDSALGKCLQIGQESPPCSTVVGIAEDTRRQQIVEGDSLLYYVPLEQAPDNLRNAGRLVVRAAGADVAALERLADAVRREALDVDPGLRYVAARPLDDIISPQLRAWRLGAGLFSAYGLLALIVAAVGLYGVVAFDVEGRRREMGVRTALGATPGAILRLVVGDGLRLAAGGVLIGLALAWLIAPSISGLLYAVPAQDTGVFAAVLLVLAGVAVLASAIPGLQATRIDPSRALRSD